MKKSLDLITERMGGETYEYFKYGQDYYVGRNTYIMDRKKKVFLESIGVTENPFGANHKLPSGHFKKIVVQKNMYLLGNGVLFSEEGQTEALNEYFKTSFDEFIIDSGLEASKKSEAWAFAYMSDGSLKFTLIPAEQLTPVYDEFDNLILMIRRFDEGKTKVMLEIDKDGTKRYEMSENATRYRLVAEYGHYSQQMAFDGEPVGEEMQFSFGQIPYFPLYNNREHTSDLYPIKQLIDTYDIINSDFANNIDDMQDAFFTLKGYAGDTKNLAEFMRQLKKYKAVPVGEDGEVEANQLEIPTEARKVFLERLEKDIYKFAMAVDLTSINGGSGITNVYIKAMFSDLDLKCNEFENEIRKYIKAILDFINEQMGTAYTDEFTFDRSIIMNKQETVDTLIKLVGLLSDETVRELLPFDIDLEQEKTRLVDQEDEVQFPKDQKGVLKPLPKDPKNPLGDVKLLGNEEEDNA